MSNRIDYRKMKPDPQKRLTLNEGVLGWNLIGKTTLNDIDNFVNVYISIDNMRNTYYRIVKPSTVRLQDICTELKMTRARFLDILMSILWSKKAFRKKYGLYPLVTNTVYSIDAAGHMSFQAKMSDEKLTMGYHFQLTN